MFKRILLITLALMLCGAPALAETISFEGTVTAAYTHEVYAASSAVVESVPVSVGDKVTAGDSIAALRTTKVYAEQDGTVTAVFGQVGDSTETLAEAYGAAIYLEGVSSCSVSASTANAYDSVANKLVYVGESVYLRSRAENTRTGTGVITSVDGESYMLNVTQGTFLGGESVNIYRTADYADEQRIGRGTVERKAPIAVAGTGRIVSVAVAPGDQVQRGDLLMETLDGSGSSRVLTAEVSGVVASLSAVQGTALEENAVAAVIWPDDAMQIEAAVSESDLMYIQPGDAVTLAFEWNADSGETLEGTVKSISAISDAESDNTAFTAFIAFSPDDSVRYGMNVTVSVQD